MNTPDRSQIAYSPSIIAVVEVVILSPKATLVVESREGAPLAIGRVEAALSPLFRRGIAGMSRALGRLIIVQRRAIALALSHIEVAAIS
jgi:hypothetical protein